MEPSYVLTDVLGLGLMHKKKLLATNIRLGWKWLTVTNALAYNDAANYYCKNIYRSNP